MEPPSKRQRVYQSSRGPAHVDAYYDDYHESLEDREGDEEILEDEDGYDSWDDEDDMIDYDAEEPDDLPDIDSNNVGFQKQKAQIDGNLKSKFEAIFEKYGKDFTGVGDEIDLETGEIVVNNGHLLGMTEETDEGLSRPREFTARTSRRFPSPDLDNSDTRFRQSIHHASDEDFDEDDAILFGGPEPVSQGRASWSNSPAFHDSAVSFEHDNIAKDRRVRISDVSDYGEGARRTSFVSQPRPYHAPGQDSVWQGPDLPVAPVRKRPILKSVLQQRESDRSPPPEIPDRSIWAPPNPLSRPKRVTHTTEADLRGESPPGRRQGRDTGDDQPSVSSSEKRKSGRPRKVVDPTLPKNLGGRPRKATPELVRPRRPSTRKMPEGDAIMKGERVIHDRTWFSNGYVSTTVTRQRTGRADSDTPDNDFAALTKRAREPTDSDAGYARMDNSNHANHGHEDSGKDVSKVGSSRDGYCYGVAWDGRPRPEVPGPDTELIAQLKKAAVESLGDDSEDLSHLIKRKSRRSDGYLQYNAADDELLVRWVVEAQKMGYSLWSTHMWMRFAASHPERPRHWTSWRNRYHRHLYPRGKLDPSECPPPILNGKNTRRKGFNGPRWESPLTKKEQKELAMGRLNPRQAENERTRQSSRLSNEVTVQQSASKNPNPMMSADTLQFSDLEDDSGDDLNLEFSHVQTNDRAAYETSRVVAEETAKVPVVLVDALNTPARNEYDIVYHDSPPSATQSPAVRSSQRVTRNTRIIRDSDSPEPDVAREILARPTRSTATPNGSTATTGKPTPKPTQAPATSAPQSSTSRKLQTPQRPDCLDLSDNDSEDAGRPTSKSTQAPSSSTPQSYTSRKLRTPQHSHDQPPMQKKLPISAPRPDCLDLSDNDSDDNGKPTSQSTRAPSSSAPQSTASKKIQTPQHSHSQAATQKRLTLSALRRDCLDLSDNDSEDDFKSSQKTRAQPKIKVEPGEDRSPIRRLRRLTRGRMRNESPRSSFSGSGRSSPGGTARRCGEGGYKCDRAICLDCVDEEYVE